MYREKRVLTAEDVREVCIQEEWYTRGTIEEYDALLNSIPDENLTTKEIVRIAEDIIVHSDETLGLTVETVGFALMNKSRSFLEKETADEREI